jgi:hypothetical protein
MPSGYEVIMVDVLTRLKASGTGWPLAAEVRRAHRTDVPRGDSSQALKRIHLVDGYDEPRKGTTRCGMRDASFTVSLFIRSADGPQAADPHKIEVIRRLSPNTTAYAAGCVYPGRITVDPDQIADVDAIRVDLEFTFDYPAAEWSLSE